MHVVNLINDNTKIPIHNRKEKLKSGNVVQGINTIDSFSFTILPSNRGFNSIFDFTTLVEVYNQNKNRYEFQGRVLCSNPDMAENGLISKTVTCESFFGFLCDSQQPYVEEKNWTVRGFLTYVIGEHNKQVEDYKKFTIGNITVTDANDNIYIGVQRENTWKTIQEKLIGKLGGEIQFRVVNDEIYIDYLEKIGVTRATTIEVSKNMKSITKEVNPSEYITRLIPLGCKISKEETTTDEDGNPITQTVETEERLDISKVNGGKNYIDFTAGIEAYGIHVGYVIYDDVTDEMNLLTKGRKWFEENSMVQVKYSVKALDLSLIGLDIDDFEVHNYHPIVNPFLGIDDEARIIKKTINICEELQSSFEIGDNFKTLTEIQLAQKKEFEYLSDEVKRLQSTSNNLKSYVSTVKTGLTNRIDGINGIFFYIRYSEYADGHVMTDAPNEKTLYIGTCSTNSETAPVDFRAYTWALIKGSDGDKGEPGIDGRSQYLHIKYSNDGTNFTANNGETVGDWIGTCVNNTETDPVEFSAYTWKKIKGEQGDEGIKGEPGADGKSQYWHIKYSNDGTNFTANNGEDTGDWIGTCVDYTETDPAEFSAYKWKKIKGEQGTDGIKGEPGADGKTQYLHIKYSNDGKTFTSNNGEDIGDWIGTCVDYTEADPVEFSAYKWKKFKGESGIGVSKTEVYYYLSDSNITQTGGSWVTTPPEWVNGKYYWQKVITTYTNGQTSESTPVCITGEKGTSGKSIVSVTTEFYLSTSKETQTGGSWVETMPEWSNGLYLWTRNKIVYENPTSEEYTAPICDSSWEAVNNIKIGGRNLLKFTSDLPIDYTLKSGIGSWSWQGLTKTDDGLRMDADSTVDSNSFQVPLTHGGAVQNGEVVTLSFEYRGNLTKFGSFYFAQETGHTALLKLDWTLEASETEWKRFEKTFSMDNANFETCTSVLLCYGHKNIDGNGAWIEIKNKSLQLEKGNKATDWTPAPEDIDDAINEKADVLTEQILEQTTKMTNTCEEIIFEALKSYTETSDYESFKETVESQLKILSDQISLKFTETIEEIEKVNGSLQSQLNTITTHFLFDINGMTIGKSNSPYKIVISNEKQTTYANDVEVQIIDAATGEVLTPKLTITEKFSLFDYVIEKDGAGYVNCDYIGN